MERVGLIDGLEPGTTSSFRVVLQEDTLVQLDDLLVTQQKLPDGSLHRTYGLVAEVYSRLEGASFLSDTARIAQEHTMPGQGMRYADVRVLRHVPELYIPPQSGAEVFKAAGELRREALYEDQMGKGVAVALDQSGMPVKVDLEFLDGTRGGHVSISGVSGVATKTSFALHLLYTLMESPQGRQALGVHAASTRALVFNVKGEDLLHFDQPSRRYAERLASNPDLAEQWRQLGIEEPGPFRSVAFYAPISRQAGNTAMSDVSSRANGNLRVYGWPPLDFVKQGLLRFCFADADDGRNQLSFVEQRVRVQLARWAHPSLEHPGAIVMIPPEHGCSFNLEKLITQKRPPRQAGDGELCRTLADILDFLENQFEVNVQEWAGNTQANTVNAFLRRLQAMAPRFGHLISDKVTSLQLEGPQAPQENVVVVDIHNLHDDGQRFVVGTLLSSVFAAKERGQRFPLHFVVLDELNKYAPRQGSSPLKEVLVDIAARGRSLGVLLIGAQQSASDVEPTVVRNAAIRVVGRLDSGESTADFYRFLTPALRERAIRLLPGTMILDQPLVPSPLPIRFPFPNYATRHDELPDMSEEESQDLFTFR